MIYLELVGLALKLILILLRGSNDIQDARTRIAKINDFSVALVNRDCDSVARMLEETLNQISNGK